MNQAFAVMQATRKKNLNPTWYREDLPETKGVTSADHNLELGIEKIHLKESTVKEEIWGILATGVLVMERGFLPFSICKTSRPNVDAIYIRIEGPVSPAVRAQVLRFYEADL